VAVVDPGVGTARKIVFAEIGARHYLAPDNGLLGLLTRRRETSQIIALKNRSYWRESVSNTFHGRDILAPVAAHLARGVSPTSLGEPISQLTPLDWPEAIVENDRLIGEVVAVDSFGNLITNMDRDLVQKLGPLSSLLVGCGGQMVAGVSATYADRRHGVLTALLGSSDRLEIAVVGGSAKAILGAGVGEKVVVKLAAAPRCGSC
jgi:S-adenosylmethionine hydrolase